MTLYVSETQSLDGATQVRQFARPLKLKSGQSKEIPARLATIPSVPDGIYFLLASVQAGQGDETAVAGPSLMIAAPFVKIAASDLRVVGPTPSAGKTAQVTITLDDTGNEPASGPVSLSLAGAPQAAGGASQSFGPATLKVKLKPGQTKAFRGKFKVPAGTPAGTYTLSGLLDLSGLGDSDVADDMVAGTATVTIR